MKALKEKTEEVLGGQHKICEAAASIPRFPALYDEDLYDAFEYIGMDYLQINWDENGSARTYLTYDTQVALAGHNISLCWDYSSANACHADDLPENLDAYLLVTYTSSDLMVSNIAAHTHNLYRTFDKTALRLGLGKDSSLRTSNEEEYWNRVRDAVLEPMKIQPEHMYAPTKLIFVGASVEEDFIAFVESQVQEYLKERNEPRPQTIAQDPMFVQAKGLAELARRRPSLPQPVRPCGGHCKETEPRTFCPAKEAQRTIEGIEL